MGNTESRSEEGWNRLRQWLEDLLKKGDLNDEDKALVREARSVITRERHKFYTDFELRIAFEGRPEEPYREGNGETKLVVQRNSKYEIEAIRHGNHPETKKMKISEGAWQIAQEIIDFFLNKAFEFVTKKAMEFVSKKAIK